jgi:protein SCO1/2
MDANNTFGIRGGRRSLAVLGIVVALVALAACGTADANGAGRTPAAPKLQGTVLDAIPAPAFALRDQNGALVTLQSLRGHPVVFTFVDSVCTQECPITAQELNQTAQLLGSRAAAVEWVALSVDPWNDTPTTAREFLSKNKVTMPLHFLLGTLDQLTPIWHAYHIQVIYNSSDIAHTVGLYVFDQQGRERVWLDAGFDPMMLSNDLKALLAS